MSTHITVVKISHISKYEKVWVGNIVSQEGPKEQNVVRIRLIFFFNNNTSAILVALMLLSIVVIYYPACMYQLSMAPWPPLLRNPVITPLFPISVTTAHYEIWPTEKSHLIILQEY